MSGDILLELSFDYIIIVNEDEEVEKIERERGGVNGKEELGERGELMVRGGGGGGEERGELMAKGEERGKGGVLVRGEEEIGCWCFMPSS